MSGTKGGEFQAQRGGTLFAYRLESHHGPGSIPCLMAVCFSTRPHATQLLEPEVPAQNPPCRLPMRFPNSISRPSSPECARQLPVRPAVLSSEGGAFGCHSRSPDSVHPSLGGRSSRVAATFGTSKRSESEASRKPGQSTPSEENCPLLCLGLRVTQKPREQVGSPRLQCSGTSVAMFSQVLSILPALPNIEGVS